MDALVGTWGRCWAGLAMGLGVLCPGGPAHPVVEETPCFYICLLSHVPAGLEHPGELGCDA